MDFFFDNKYVCGFSFIDALRLVLFRLTLSTFDLVQMESLKGEKFYSKQIFIEIKSTAQMFTAVQLLTTFNHFNCTVVFWRLMYQNKKKATTTTKSDHNRKN